MDLKLMRLLCLIMLSFFLLLPCAANAGLKGEYWNVASGNIAIPNRAADFTRIDPNINFDWGTGRPASSINNNYFVVRWTGTLRAPRSGLYTFKTSANNGVRLWIDGNLLISNWNASGGNTRTSREVYLVANTKYDIRMEFNELTRSAYAQLSWERPRSSGFRTIAATFFESPPIVNVCNAGVPPPLLFSDDFFNRKPGWQARNFDPAISAWPNDQTYVSSNQEHRVVFNNAGGELQINGSISPSLDNEFGMVGYQLRNDGVATELISNYVINSKIWPDPSYSNNDVGIVFGFIDDRNYYVARWTRYGSRYRTDTRFPGNYRQLELIRLSNGVATRLAGLDNFYANNWLNLKVVVKNNDITVCVNDQVKLFAQGAAPFLNEFGIFTYDNDDGVYVDEIQVWGEKVAPILATLTSEWRFDQLAWAGNSGEVVDQVGSNDGVANNGAQTNNLSPALSGTPGTCRYGQFDGLNDYVTLQNTLANNFSITGWIRPNKDFTNTNLSYFGDPIFWSDSVNSVNDFIVAGVNVAGENKLAFMTGSTSGDKTLISNQSIILNQWTHITVTRNGQTGVISLYINGQFDSAMNTDNFNRLNANSIVAVAGNLTDSRYFSGDIDEVHFYDGVLRQSQISTITTATHPCPVILAPVLEMRFDQMSWNGPNAVLDSSGAGHHGTAFNTTSVTSPYCRAADFSADSISDYISIDHQAMNGLNDFSVVFWGKTNASGDLTALSAAKDNSDGGPNEAVLYFSGGYDSHRFWPTIAESPFDTGTKLANSSNLADGQWHQYVWTRDGGSKRSCFWLDGQAQGCVTHDKGGARAVALNGLILGQEQDSVGGGFVRSQNWKGLIDELLVFERVLTATEISSIRQNIEAGLTWQGDPKNCGVNVDHYRLEYQSSALTCQASAVTVKACANANCDVLVTDSVSGTLAPATHWLGGKSISFTGQVNADLAIITEQAVTLGFSSLSHPAPMRCFRDNNEVGDCKLTFKDSGFIFSNIPTQVSNKPSNLEYNNQTLTVKAVTKNTTTDSCRAVFPDNSTVNLELEYRCDGDCSASPVELTNNNKLHQLTNSFASYPLTFDSDSTAIFSLRYPDAAKLALAVRKNVVLDTNVSVELEGQSNSFVVKPFGFKLSLEAGQFFADDDDDPVFKRAGRNFKVNIKPIGWLANQDVNQGVYDGRVNKGITVSANPLVGYFANYLNESVRLTHQLLLPSDGDSGTFTAQVGGFSGNKAQVTANWNEVGIIDLSASSNGLNGYLGTDTIVGFLPNVGRFIPDHFEVTATNGSLAGQCTSYTYLGEPLQYATVPALHILAKNSDNDTTVNYFGGFNKLSASAITIDAPTQDGIKLGADSLTLLNVSGTVNSGTLSAYQESGVVKLGEFSYQLSDADRFNYLKDPNSLVGQFTGDINLAVTKVLDGDLVSGFNLPSIKPSVPEIRFGRAFLNNVFGSEHTDLMMPLEYQYWDGSQFVINSDDNCTAYQMPLAILAPTSLGSLTLAGLTTQPLSADAGAGGAGGVRLIAAQESGSVTVELNVPAWLRFDLAGGSSFIDNPQGSAFFGRYRGNDRVIYWREVKN